MDIVLAYYAIMCGLYLSIVILYLTIGNAGLGLLIFMLGGVDMDVNVITALVGSMGFPIVMCGALCFYIYKVQDKLTTMVAENTKAIEKLVNKIEKLDK